MMAEDAKAMVENAENHPEFQLKNPNLNETSHMYHFGINVTDPLLNKLHDVKFICMGGKGSRMKNFAEWLYQSLGCPENCEFEEGVSTNGKKLRDLASHAGRFSMFKVGPVLSVSHGMGTGSISVALHEILKLIHFAKCTNVTFIRIGTSGGLGLKPGTVIVTKKAYNGLLEPFFRQIACGTETTYNTETDEELRQKLLTCAKDLGIENAVIGNTMAVDDFYEGQARLDGAFASFTEDDKTKFIRKCHDECGIRNFEMESSCFIATCNRVKVKCAVVCACVIDRFKNDEITANRSLLGSWESYPQQVAAELIKRHCDAL